MRRWWVRRARVDDVPAPVRLVDVRQATVDGCRMVSLDDVAAWMRASAAELASQPEIGTKAGVRAMAYALEHLPPDLRVVAGGRR